MLEPCSPYLWLHADAKCPVLSPGEARSKQTRSTILESHCSTSTGLRTQVGPGLLGWSRCSPGTGIFFFFLSAQHRSPCGLPVSGQQRVGLLLVWAHSSVELAEPLLWLVAVLSWLIGLHVASKNPFGVIGRQRRPYCRCHCPIWKGTGQRAGYFFLL